MGIGGVVSSNRVNTRSRAYIEDSDGDASDMTSTVVTAGLGVNVDAQDDAEIYSNTKVVSSSVTTSDGGATVLENATISLLPVQHSVDGSSNAAVDVDLEDLVRIEDGFPGAGMGTGDVGSVYEFLGG